MKLSARLVILIVFAAISGAFSSAQAQGEFVARGAYGLSVGGEMMPDGDRTSYLATAGFSIKGTLDVRLGYGWLDTDADTLGGQIKGRALRPGAQLHIIKQGNRYPFSLSAVGSYQRSTWDAEMIGAENVSGSMYEIGGVLHTIFQIAEFAGMRPWFSVVYQNRDREYAFPDMSPMNVERDDTKYIGGLQVIVMPTARSVFFAGPSVIWIGGERTIGVIGGLVIN